MAKLLDWHATCHASHAYDVPEEQHYPERDGAPDDPLPLAAGTEEPPHDE